MKQQFSTISFICLAIAMLSVILTSGCDTGHTTITCVPCVNDDTANSKSNTCPVPPICPKYAECPECPVCSCECPTVPELDCSDVVKAALEYQNQLAN